MGDWCLLNPEATGSGSSDGVGKHPQKASVAGTALLGGSTYPPEPSLLVLYAYLYVVRLALLKLVGVLTFDLIEAGTVQPKILKNNC